MDNSQFSISRYPLMNDSGIEWIGEIPEHWNTKNIKYLAIEKDTLFTDGDWIESKDIVFDDSHIRYITTGNVGAGCYKEQGSTYITEETYQRLNCTEIFPEDLLISRLNPPIGRCCIIPDLGKRVITSVDNVVLRPNKMYFKKFLMYAMSNSRYFEYTSLIARGATMQRISRGLLGNIAIPVTADKPEQTTIANYLDRKTAEIDELIAQKERLLSLYEEEKTAIINQAVTKGIDPDVKLKDSGIDWLGEIPEHWEVKPLKMATKIIRGKFGHRPRNDPAFYDGEYPFIQTGDVAFAGKYVGQFHQTLNEKGFSVSQEFPIDTLVMTIAANIGDLAILSFKACFPDSIVGFYPLHKNSSEFLYYLFSSMKTEFLRVSTNNTQLNINIDRISPLKIPVPPEEEQIAIVHYIETETARIDANITKTKRIITLQKEYRTALISEVVTGKIKVTQVA